MGNGLTVEKRFSHIYKKQSNIFWGLLQMILILGEDYCNPTRLSYNLNVLCRKQMVWYLETDNRWTRNPLLSQISSLRDPKGRFGRNDNYQFYKAI
jgi:hypothetical protein